MRLHYAIAVPVFPIRSFLFLKGASIKDVLLTREGESWRGRGGWRGGGEGILEYRGRGSENSDSGRTSSMDAPLGGILDRYHAKSLIFYL